jgi:hypothetical protein
VPPPTIENFSIPELTKKGATIKVNCHYKGNMIYEVKYDFEIKKSQTKMPSDSFYIYGLMQPKSTPQTVPEGECAYLVRALLNEETFENDCNNIIMNEFDLQDKGIRDLRDLGNGSINLEFTSLKNSSQHESIKE